MSDKVVSLRGEPVEADRRRDFMDYVSAQYDDFTADHGSPPKGMMVLFTDDLGKSNSGVFAIEGHPILVAEALAFATLSVALR